MNTSDFLAAALRNPVNETIADELLHLALPDAWIVSGCLVQTIGESGLQLDSAIEIVSCALTAAGLYFSVTGDAKGWFNG